MDLHNPRVRLMAAQLRYAAATSVQERAELLDDYLGAVDAFEIEREEMEHGAAWGGADAWQSLAQVYLDRGDAIAARAALEQALQSMPDYRSAHRLLNQMLTG